MWQMWVVRSTLFRNWGLNCNCAISYLCGLGQCSTSGLSKPKFKPVKQWGNLMRRIGDQVMKSEEPDWGWRGNQRLAGSHPS